MPFQFLGKAELTCLKSSSLVIDLAAAPYGISEEDKRFCDVKIITASGLPGKTAFESAGRIVFETVLAILRERGMAV